MGGLLRRGKQLGQARDALGNVVVAQCVGHAKYPGAPNASPDTTATLASSIATWATSSDELTSVPAIRRPNKPRTEGKA